MQKTDRAMTAEAETSGAAAPDKPEHFVFFLIEDFSHLAFSCAVEPLRIANLISGRPLYRWSFASENGETATCSNGSVTLVHRDFGPLERHDRLFVLSGIGVRDRASPGLLAALRRERARGTAIGALCSGAWILARAGFLDGVPAAIHWDFHDSFMEEFPEVPLVRNVFVNGEKFITASGGTATADLMIHLIEQAHGHDLAVAVADQMVYNAVREPTAEQRVSFQSRHGMRNAHLAYAIRRMHENIETPLSPGAIAREIGISARQLERLFGRYMNCSPKKYYMDMRLQRARQLLVQSERSITEIAHATGFASASHFSRVYRTQYGLAPARQRDRLG